MSGNAKVIKAGKLSAVASGPEALFRQVEPLIEVFAPNGVSYVGEGELARVCKIAHNVMLGVVIENLIEIMLLAEKAGVPRHAFLAFINNGVMGSMFTRYKSPALVNLDWTTTFTPELLRKDMDLGLALGTDVGVPMPVTAAAREVLQSHFGAAQLKDDPEKYLGQDFAALLETMAIGAGVKLKSENKPCRRGWSRRQLSPAHARESGHPELGKELGPRFRGDERRIADYPRSHCTSPSSSRNAKRLRWSITTPCVRSSVASSAASRHSDNRSGDASSRHTRVASNGIMPRSGVNSTENLWLQCLQSCCR